LKRERLVPKSRKLVRPIVEFFPVDAVESKRGARWELFTDRYEDETTHRYSEGVKQELQRARGIYMFYDSRGRALYAGKAVEQSLWAEMNAVFNRSRDEVQRIKLVSHPYRNVAYKSSKERVRRIVDQSVKLHDLAAYVSAYEVSPPEMIGMFEALIIRAFANDLLNKRMESFD
jgi:hypothetical protein